jgi:hypothetical protein
MASGNIVTDIIAKFSKKELTHKRTSAFTNRNATSWNFFGGPKCKTYWN